MFFQAPLLLRDSPVDFGLPKPYHSRRLALGQNVDEHLLCPGFMETDRTSHGKLTWLALGEDQTALSRRVEQLTALPRPVKP